MSTENQSGFQRLFIAISVPEAVRKEIARMQARLKRASPSGSVRWTRSEQFHITLKFLGDVPINQLETLKDSIASACAGMYPPQIAALGTGFFPNRRNPRIIWIGAHDDTGSTVKLHRRMTGMLHWLLPAERSEKFTGHITLGRFKPGHHASIPRTVEQATVFHRQFFGQWQADEIELVRSELNSTGAEHTAIAIYPLNAPQP